jgi:hypothetical protein
LHAAGLDYEIKLKSELEIMTMHNKLDGTRIDSPEHMVIEQGAQLSQILDKSGARPLAPCRLASDTDHCDGGIAALEDPTNFSASRAARDSYRWVHDCRHARRYRRKNCFFAGRGDDILKCWFRQQRTSSAETLRADVCSKQREIASTRHYGEVSCS